ncbi:MAG: LacI family transcriptional regulator [Armatimonadetes bacterium]|nr:LacI family transcriptional regulator [Armatimonadota bacterium]
MASSETSKTVTISDVARAVGLSKTTVSTALSGNGRLSEETREMVRREAEKLGYEADFFAQGLRKKRNDLIGFFSPGLDLGVSTLKTQAITQRLYARGYNVPVVSYGCRENGEFFGQEELLTDLRRRKPRAMICSTRNLQYERAQQELRRYLEDGGIAVCFDWPIAVETDAVLFDRVHNSYVATRHLLEMGHRDIGFYIPGVDISTDPRVQGFSQALAEWTLEPRAEWIFCGGFHLEAEHEGRWLAEKFLKLARRPTAMAVVNDITALAFAAQIKNAGIEIPRDLSLVGHDGRAASEIGFLPLTTVTHPVEAIADAVVDMLESRLSGGSTGPARREIVRGHLIQRQSVRCLN